MVVRCREPVTLNDAMKSLPRRVAMGLKWWLGGDGPLAAPTYAGGFDWIYDCVGSGSSVDESMRVAGPHGHIVMVGCAAEVSHLDMTFLWNRELQISGCYVYGKERSMEGKPHTFKVAMDLILGHEGVDLSRLITHRFTLDQWQEAMQVSLARGKHGAIKPVFDMRG